MKWFNILRDRLRALRQRDSVLNDIDREMRTHLHLQIEENLKAGMSPQQARDEANRSFGNLNRALARVQRKKIFLTFFFYMCLTLAQDQQ